MRYILVNELINVLSDQEQIDLSSDLDSENVDTEIIEDCILRAESFCDSYLSRRYTVPVVTSYADTPGALRDCVLMVAKYMLFERRLLRPDDVLRQSYLDRVEWLMDVANFRANLVFDIGGSPNLVGEGATTTSDVGTYTNTDDVFDDTKRPN